MPRPRLAVRLLLALLLVLATACGDDDGADPDPTEDDAAVDPAEDPDGPDGLDIEDPAEDAPDTEDATDGEDPADGDAADDGEDATAGGSLDDLGDHGTPVLRTTTDWVDVGGTTEVYDLTIELPAVDEVLGGDLLLTGPAEVHGGWHVVGDIVLLDRFEVEVLGVDVENEEVDVQVRQLVRRPDLPMAMTLPDGMRELAGVRVAISGEPGGDDIEVSVAVGDDEAVETITIGDTVTLLDHEVRLLERTRGLVSVEVDDPDGRPLVPDDEDDETTS